MTLEQLLGQAAVIAGILLVPVTTAVLGFFLGRRREERREDRFRFTGEKREAYIRFVRAANAAFILGEEPKIASLQRQEQTIDELQSAYFEVALLAPEEVLAPANRVVVATLHYRRVVQSLQRRPAPDDPVATDWGKQFATFVKACRRDLAVHGNVDQIHNLIRFTMPFVPPPKPPE